MREEITTCKKCGIAYVKDWEEDGSGCPNCHTNNTEAEKSASKIQDKIFECICDYNTAYLRGDRTLNHAESRDLAKMITASIIGRTA